MTEQQADGFKRRKRLGNDRIAELLDIAAGVFISEGFAAASMNEIARRANASKNTFYSRFPTKQDLFLAVIERRMSDVYLRVARFPEEQTIEKTLHNFCMNLLCIALAPEQIDLIRMISMESTRYPMLAARYYENGPRKAESALADYLAGEIARGRLRPADPLLMARQLMSLTAGSPVRWFVLGLHPAQISNTAMRKHVDQTLSFFFKGYSA